MIGKEEYHSYYAQYIEDLASNDKSIIENMIFYGEILKKFLSEISIEKESYRYADGKWTIKELLQHVIDTERIFCYRALRFARNDKTALHSFEHDDYNLVSNANNRTMKSLLSEFDSVRKSSISLFESFNNEMLKRTGVASGNNMSVRAIGYLISGHANHHLNIFKERYL